jgi:sarcosine oxidase subunit gamma
MAEADLRTAPVPAEPAVSAGVTIALGGPWARYSLRARDAKALGKAIKRKVPAKIGETGDGLACLGPDEWLLRVAPGTSVPLGEGLPLSVVDISERAVTLVIEGDRAIEVLSAGCPRDVSKFPVGYATRTVFETVEVVLIRESETRFAVDVWRSFAPWLWGALTTAAGHLR